MKFETPRLCLRDWHPAQDARHAMDIYGDVRVMRWMKPGDGPHHSTARDISMRQVQGRLAHYAGQTSLAKNGTRSWAVVQKDIGRVIGAVVLAMMPDMEEVRADHVPEPIEDGLPTEYVEIGWYFRPSSWGLGYASEAAGRIVRYGFESLNLPMLLAVTQPENARSLAVIQRLGMCPEGVTARCYGGKSLLLHTLTAEKWAEMTLAQEQAEL